MEKFVYNPINDKSPCGAVVKGTKITYTIKVSKFVNVSHVNFVMHKDKEASLYYKMQRTFADEKYVHYSISMTFENIGFYWYHFEAVTGDNTIKLIRSDSLDVINSNADSDFLQLIFESESKVDPAFRRGIIYHIFVDRFNRSGDVTPRAGLHLIDDWEKPLEIEYEKGERVNNNCYGGNFRGIIEKLDYLKKLNVGTIYLSPVFEANSSHKYNVADYSKVDSMFGTEEEFVELITKAKRKGIRIIIDGVFNHTGSDSIYFNKNGRYKTVGAYQSKNSKYYDWYDFTKYPDNYSCWWGIKTLPQTREESGFFDYISGENGIVSKYMKLGLGGLRLDVVDELTNNFLHSICQSARKVEPKCYIVGEVWDDASTKISYDERKEYFLGGNLDSVTNYPMKNAILDFIKYGNVAGFVNIVNLIKDQYPKAIQNNLMNILDTHDTRRALTVLGMEETDLSDTENYILSKEERMRGIELLKLATIMQYTVMGIPTVFYGDEAGMEGMKDPFARGTYPWGKEDIGLIEWYENLGKLRTNKVFDGGDLNIKYAKDSVIIYERVRDDNKVIVAINRSSEPFEFVLSRTMCNYFTGDYVSGKQILEPDTAFIFV